jgi:hypothetical protein
MAWDDMRQAAERLADTKSADILLYTGDINQPGANRTLGTCALRRRPNVILILVTFGGVPDAAYRIGRYLQNTYATITLLVPSFCKSSGTLIATAAHELVMADAAELGPLDIQMAKPDEVIDETRSGFIVNDAFAAMQREALEMLKQCFLDLKRNTAGATITGKTAIQTASSLTGTIFGHLYGQVDPMHMGEAYRAGRVAREYGQRLSEKGENLKDTALDSMIAGYPSHSFVIDRQEAGKLFNNVREPNDAEAYIIKELGMLARVPWPNGPIVEYLSFTEEEVRNAQAANQRVATAAPPEPERQQQTDGDTGPTNEGAQVTPFPQGS